ncbi:hypothetical protein RJ53_06790 [Methanocalculus chunghsingensis]|uniref:4Fe-4S ferredoxin-type domain-containing protein n=1 Tax=Methanocalculus chunghsingensis TaxID=156457 RepID=A0A8J7WAP9_9EURY|nr:hypothetical protein [Methanocalculus chunghsingensis]MBR1369217.1 hypothetical protein [Methanocalculus chunghsingensis]
MNGDQEIICAALEKALELGVDVAGAVPAARLINCPSAIADGHQGSDRDRGTYIILGLFHDPADPDLDLWEEGRGTPGDRILGEIGRSLCRWLAETSGREAYTIPYRLEDGGIYLKDAACMAGIGIIGANNLVLVPGFGPRIRFRAVWVDLKTHDPNLPPLVLPCADCGKLCHHACPMHSFSSGRYSRSRCMERMNKDKERGSGQADHCRACELACPAWKGL